jgi:hypothetical protein
MVPLAMSSIVEEVHQWASQDEQVREDTEEVCAVFRPQEEADQGKEANQRPFPATVLLLICCVLVHVVHDVLQRFERDAHSTIGARARKTMTAVKHKHRYISA